MKRYPKPPLKPKGDFVEERDLGNGEVERIYHGKAAQSAECRKALDIEGREALQEVARTQTTWKARLTNGRVKKVDERQLEKLERQGRLAAYAHRFRGWSPEGEYRVPSCSACGATHVRLRSVNGSPLFCVKSSECRDRVLEPLEEMRGLAAH